MALVLQTACAARLFTPPVGPPMPAPGAADTWREATSACRNIETYRATGRMSARLAERRMPTVGLGIAVDSTGRIGMEARVSGTLVFKLGGTAADATLFMRDGARIVTARADDIVDALVGVKLGPERLLGILSGCPSRASSFERAERVGEFVKATASDAVVYLLGSGGWWRPRAASFDGLVVDYREFARGRPRVVTIASEPARTPVASIALTFDDTTVNEPIDPAILTVHTENTTSMSLDELRNSGPLGGAR